MMTNIVMTHMFHIRMIIRCSDNRADGWDDEWEREHSTNKTKGSRPRQKIRTLGFSTFVCPPISVNPSIQYRAWF